MNVSWPKKWAWLPDTSSLCSPLRGNVLADGKFVPSTQLDGAYWPPEEFITFVADLNRTAELPALLDAEARRLRRAKVLDDDFPILDIRF